MNCCHTRSTVLLVLLAFVCLPAIVLAGAGNGDVNVETNDDLMFEGFEANTFPPAGWYKIHLGNSYSWSRSSAAAQTGNYSAYCRDGSVGSPQDEYLVTPALDFSNHIDPQVGWYEEQVNWDSRGGTHYIMVSTTSQTDPSTFTVVAEMTPDTHSIAGFGNDPVYVDLSAFGGEATVYIAFRYVGEDSDYWFIDDVRVFELSGADYDATPSSVLPSNISYNDGDSFTPIGHIYNNGSQEADIDVTMEILESGTVVYTETMQITGLASAGTEVVSFPDFTVSEGHLLELRCTTFLDGDQIPANDTRSSYNTAYSQVHVPMGLLFTNAGCGPCVSANQTLDAYIPGQGNDVGLARIHVSWPGSDIMYNANPAQSNAMVSDYGVSGVPNMFIDGTYYGTAQFVSVYNARQLLKSPQKIELFFNDETDELTVKVHNLEMQQERNNFKLRAVITEDDVYYAGSNGETRHHQAMRHFWPDTDGLDCPTTLGTHTFVIDAPLTGSWVYDNLRATVYLQDMDTREMIQSGTNFLTEIDDGLAPVGEPVQSAIKLNANYPNPFNPSTTISFSLPRNEQVELTVYSVDGAKVATLLNEEMSEGSHQVMWTGKDSNGATMASGAYFYRLMTPSFSETRVMTLIK